jgi:hypothetical protein
LQHSQLEEISISEPFDELRAISPDWASSASKARRKCYGNCRTQGRQKLKNRQLFVSILSFVFAVCL